MLRGVQSTRDSYAMGEFTNFAMFPENPNFGQKLVLRSLYCSNLDKTSEYIRFEYFLHLFCAYIYLKRFRHGNAVKSSIYIFITSQKIATILDALIFSNNETVSDGQTAYGGAVVSHNAIFNLLLKKGKRRNSQSGSLIYHYLTEDSSVVKIRENEVTD